MSKFLSSEIAIVFLILVSITFSFTVYFLFRFLSLLPERIKQTSLTVFITLITTIFLLFVLDYISTRKEVCLSCHSLNAVYEPHKKLECLTCHQESGFSGWADFKLREASMLIRFRKYRQGESFSCLPNQVCLSCHNKIIKTTAGKRVKVRHSDFSNLYRCIECHEKQVHAVYNSPPNAMSVCFGCHKELKDQASCLYCHRSPQSYLDYLSALNLKHSGNWLKVHGFKNTVYCKPCHEENEFCKKCHSNFPHDKSFLPAHGQHALRNVFECRNCHLIIKCNECHGTEMPHPESWIKDHASKAVIDWSYKCSRCHTLQSCASCHNASFLEKFSKKVSKR